MDLHVFRSILLCFWEFLNYYQYIVNRYYTWNNWAGKPMLFITLYFCLFHENEKNLSFGYTCTHNFRLLIKYTSSQKYTNSHNSLSIMKYMYKPILISWYFHKEHDVTDQTAKFELRKISFKAIINEIIKVVII